MIRRAVMVAAAAVALIVAPAAAMAQAAAPQAAFPRAPAGSGFPVVDPSPAAGVPFTVRASGARANESVTLRITRRPASNGSHPRSLTKSANASGVVDFVVTIAEDGTYTLVSTSASGSTLSRQSVTVVDQGTVIVAGEGAAASSAGSAPAAAPRVGGRLASTGLQGLGLAGGGGVLVLAGAGLVRVGRRREAAQASG
jgi:hypothetical protein